MRGRSRYCSQECIDAYMTNNKRTIKDMANRDFHAQNQLSFGYSFAKQAMEEGGGRGEERGEDVD